jgi:stearoyl-CoA desaturase (delta-9 desaturase)
MGAIDIALFGAIPGALILIVQIAWIPFWAAGVINGIGHFFGYRNWDVPAPDASRNIVPIAMWIGGEELHNNHHAFPSSAKFALRRFEFDIGWAAIKLFEFFGLATVLRVAPSLDVRPNIAMPDGETLKALLSHRFHAMTDYYRNVMLPALREDAQHAGERMRDLPRKWRKALADNGRWLDPQARARLHDYVQRSPRLVTLIDYRARLAAVLEERQQDAATTLARLHDWCREAEASGIRALEEFAMRLRGYALRPVPIGTR